MINKNFYKQRIVSVLDKQPAGMSQFGLFEMSGIPDIDESEVEDKDYDNFNFFINLLNELIDEHKIKVLKIYHQKIGCIESLSYNFSELYFPSSVKLEIME